MLSLLQSTPLALPTALGPPQASRQGPARDSIGGNWLSADPTGHCLDAPGTQGAARCPLPTLCQVQGAPEGCTCSGPARPAEEGGCPLSGAAPGRCSLRAGAEVRGTGQVLFWAPVTSPQAPGPRHGRTHQRALLAGGGTRRASPGNPHSSLGPGGLGWQEGAGRGRAGASGEREGPEAGARVARPGLWWRLVFTPGRVRGLTAGAGLVG